MPRLVAYPRVSQMPQRTRRKICRRNGLGSLTQHQPNQESNRRDTCSGGFSSKRLWPKVAVCVDDAIRGVRYVHID
jgi:hypothetical protein